MVESKFAIETKGVTKRFGGFTALEDVDFRVGRGSIHALIGPNGAGKTTLVGTVLGYLRPTKGSVYIDGVPVTRWSAWRRARLGIGRSFQVPEIFGGMSVVENVAVAVALSRRRALIRTLSRLSHSELRRRGR